MPYQVKFQIWNKNTKKYETHFGGKQLLIDSNGDVGFIENSEFKKLTMEDGSKKYYIELDDECYLNKTKIKKTFKWVYTEYRCETCGFHFGTKSKKLKYSNILKTKYCPGCGMEVINNEK